MKAHSMKAAGVYTLYLCAVLLVVIPFALVGMLLFIGVTGHSPVADAWAFCIGLIILWVVSLVVGAVVSELVEKG